MANQGTDEPILDIWRASAPDLSVPLASPRAAGRARSYTDILSPSRQDLSASLLVPREITNDAWTRVLRAVCWKTDPRLR